MTFAEIRLLVLAISGPVMLAPLLFVSSGSASEGPSHKSSFSRFTSSHLTPNRHLRALWFGPRRYCPLGGELSALEVLKIFDACVSLGRGARRAPKWNLGERECATPQFRGKRPLITIISENFGADFPHRRCFVKQLSLFTVCPQATRLSLEARYTAIGALIDGCGS
jgi:hypothetical protein